MVAAAQTFVGRNFLVIAVVFMTACSSSSNGDGGRRGGAASSSSCALGFRELFHFAKGRAWSAEEGAAFGALSQPERNDAVKALAREANERAALERAQGKTPELGDGAIKTEDCLGADGVTYTAFWVEGA